MPITLGLDRIELNGTNLKAANGWQHEQCKYNGGRKDYDVEILSTSEQGNGALT